MTIPSSSHITAHLPRYSADQRRFVACCTDPEVLKLVPLGNEGTMVFPVADHTAEAPVSGLRTVWRSPDQRVHFEAYLYDWDLTALGVSEAVLRHAPLEGVLGSLLKPLVRPLLEVSRLQVSRLLGCDVKLAMQRIEPGLRSTSAELPAFVASGLPRLGRLNFGVSTALIGACEALPWSPAVSEAAQRIPLEWEVQASCGSFARDVQRNLSQGDVVRTPLPSIADTEVTVALVPRLRASDARSTHAIPRRQLKLAIDRWGWIRTKFEGKEMSESTEQNTPIDQLTVPITLHLPLSSMSLLEISRFTPGWLVETGVRLHDVEVSLSTAGQRFAFGRLVAIGDELGVQITRMGNS